jgi:hypothetical protein
MEDHTVELLAQAIHHRYVAQYLHNGVGRGGFRATTAWHELDDLIREANRAQARDIEIKLARIGLSVVAGDADHDEFELGEAELEALARDEHYRWKQHHRKAAARREHPALRRHPCLVPWERLPEHEREKDRSVVRNIPGVLAEIGLRVARLTDR